MSVNSENTNGRRRSPRKKKEVNYKVAMDLYQRGPSERKRNATKKRKRREQYNQHNANDENEQERPTKKPRTSCRKAKEPSILTENTNTMNVPMSSTNVQLLRTQYAQQIQLLHAQHAKEIQRIKEDYCKPRKTTSNGHAQKRKRVNTTHLKQKAQKEEAALAQNDELLEIITDYMNENDDIHIDKLLTKCLSVKLIYILFQTECQTYLYIYIAPMSMI
eukprot:494068_1